MANNKQNIILKDILWYLIGNIIPLLIGLIKSPIFTRIFSTEDYGAYSLVLLLFGYISIICYSWIISCGWRYFHQYKEKKSLHILFSNLTFLYVLLSFIVFIAAIIWINFTDNVLIRKLIGLCFLQFLTSEIIALYFIKSRLEGKTFYYNILQSIKAIGSFALLILFTFILNWGIEAFLISNIILNVFLIFIVVIPEIIKMKLSPKFIKKSELIILYKYGQIGIVINLCTALLVSSDRFIIEYFTGLSEVGIYNQNYNIAQISITMLITVFWAALNPYLLPIFEFRPEDTHSKIYHFFKLYFYIFFPITLYFILYGEVIAEIMLGINFRIGYAIIQWTAIAEFIMGLCFLSISNLKFKNKISLLSSIFILALVINVALNILLIPKYDYRIAALTTVISNIVLFFFFYWKDKESRFLMDLFRNRDFFYCIFLLIIQIGIHFFTYRFSFDMTYYIIEGAIFSLSYIYIALRCKWIHLKTII